MISAGLPVDRPAPAVNRETVLLTRVRRPVTVAKPPGVTRSRISTDSVEAPEVALTNLQI
jgi:hypothetical protein